MLKHAVLSGGMPISRVAQHLLCTTVGEVLQGADADVLPLPVDPSTPEEGRLLQALSAGTTPAEASTTFRKSIVAAGRHSWLFLLVAAVNYLYLGQQAPSEALPPVSPQPISEGQRSAIAYLAEQVDIFVDHVPGVMPEFNWEAVLHAHKRTYAGELLVKGLPLTWQQVEPTLPAPELCGSISAEALAAPPIREWIRNPAWAIKPRSEWPRRFRRTKVRVRPGEYPDLIRGLYRHNIISFLPDAELVYDSTGAPLVNGIFGMPKEDATSLDFDPLTCVLRLILNLTPSNEVQRVISGEVKSLPLLSQ